MAAACFHEHRRQAKVSSCSNLGHSTYIVRYRGSWGGARFGMNGTWYVQGWERSPWVKRKNNKKGGRKGGNHTEILMSRLSFAARSERCVSVLRSY